MLVLLVYTVRSTRKYDPSMHNFKVSIANGSYMFRLRKVSIIRLCMSEVYKVKQRYPATGRGGPRGSGRLKPQIISTFGTTRVVGRQPNAPAAFTAGEIPGINFSEAESTSEHTVLSEGTTEKIPSDPTGNRSRDRPTSSSAP
jgi:hypothetical protein